MSGDTHKSQDNRTFTQPSVIIRHPRHRTGVHTDAVATSSGTPGPPIITAILDQPRAIHRQSFHFDTRGHRTGAHTGETSTPLEGPWTPLQQPYSISRRTGPLNKRVPFTGKVFISTKGLPAPCFDIHTLNKHEQARLHLSNLLSNACAPSVAPCGRTRARPPARGGRRKTSARLK